MSFSPDMIKEKLKQIKVFHNVAGDPLILDQIVSVLKTVHVRKGETIIKEGATGEDMYILFRGSIEISKTTMEGEPYTVANLKDSMNVCIGELALVDNDKRSATVVAVTDCDLLVLDRKSFQAFGQKNPEAAWKVTLEIAGILSARLRKANEDAVVLFETLVSELSA